MDTDYSKVFMQGRDELSETKIGGFCFVEWLGRISRLAIALYFLDIEIQRTVSLMRELGFGC